MSSQSRNSDQSMVSLPSIHELFPEHLMNPPHAPGSSKVAHRSNQDHSRNTYSPSTQPSHPQARPPAAQSPAHSQWSRHQPVSLYTSGQRRIGESRAHQSPSATLPPRPQDAPHSYCKAETVDTLSMPDSHPMSSMSISHHRDHHQGHAGVPIHSGRPPRGQDRIGHPDAQPIPSSDPSQPWTMHQSGPSPPPQPLDDPENPSDGEAPTAGGPSGIPRKHICRICHKAFNRPSSLKIHYNTHTGATPFRCPWPKCGREFNVNSNMRRHLRNHTANVNPETQEDGLANEAYPQPQNITHRHQVPPPRYGVPAHVSESPQHHGRYSAYDYIKDDNGMDVDEIDEYHASEDPHRSSRVPVPVTRVSETLTVPRGTTHTASRYHGVTAPQQEYQPHRLSNSSSSTSMQVRALTPGSSFHSSSPSPSPSPSLSPTSSIFNSPPPSTLTSPARSPAVLPRPPAGQQYQYSPSMPYLRSVRDSRVSTALRPAFDSNSSVAVRR
ncbi:hypothetical protein P691DRAFT_777521 [Macrolepiota fuliginosa MF-IS2]|uniref:C2H2-type domain-containing protein n=1 Tax=Macrolepiota fuliginosa MF-IS2 TaxID=1400762 RepID=A0A9P5X643_9AGAR|nr:hypothetical protein P691DRAFT_777521 [Macrolepiota fuliginosa MF-IS2]